MIDWVNTNEKMPEEHPMGEFLTASDFVLVCIKSPVTDKLKMAIDRTMKGKWQRTPTYFQVTHWAEITEPNTRK